MEALINSAEMPQFPCRVLHLPQAATFWGVE